VDEKTPETDSVAPVPKKSKRSSGRKPSKTGPSGGNMYEILTDADAMDEDEPEEECKTPTRDRYRSKSPAADRCSTTSPVRRSLSSTAARVGTAKLPASSLSLISSPQALESPVRTASASSKKKGPLGQSTNPGAPSQN
jgi:hypothetical protein